MVILEERFTNTGVPAECYKGEKEDNLVTKLLPKSALPSLMWSPSQVIRSRRRFSYVGQSSIVVQRQKKIIHPFSYAHPVCSIRRRRCVRKITSAVPLRCVPVSFSVTVATIFKEPPYGSISCTSFKALLNCCKFLPYLSTVNCFSVLVPSISHEIVQSPSGGSSTKDNDNESFLPMTPI
uniref:Uncharacterized protein n=1 Tax=Romanomermis culicivorax TaxID=13658 RepID=A0A915JBL0_ROMCU